MITKAQAALFDRLMRDGATVIEATSVVQLASALDAIELGWSDAYLREIRGPHGQWIREGAVSESGTVKIVPRSRAATPTASRPKAITAKAAKTDITKVPVIPGLDIPDGKPVTGADLARFQAEVSRSVTAAFVDMTTASESRIQDKADALFRLSQLKQRAVEDKRLAEKTRRKAAVEIGITVGGLILAVLEGLIGAPGISQILAAAGPPVVQAITEWRKRL